ncbi:MAG: hypothetical protein HY514_04005 [Candidatus Aenigmarchaeota archaeon]|nr:hypothetical protein [Candidatus Aenigmarchaeota archaeon]
MTLSTRTELLDPITTDTVNDVLRVEGSGSGAEKELVYAADILLFYKEVAKL